MLFGSLLHGNISISFGGYSCTILQPSEFNASCLILRSASTPPTLLAPTVLVPGYGFAAEKGHQGSLMRGFYINNISPSVGSILGGLMVKISGFGFSPSYPNTHSVLLVTSTAAVICEVQNVSFSSLFCFIGQTSFNMSKVDVLVNVTVTLNDLPALCLGMCRFLFSPKAVPSVTSISPTSAFPGSTVIVKGTAFTSHTQVFIGHKECLNIRSVTPTSLSCAVPNDRFGLYFVSVNVPELGNSNAISNNVTYKQPLRITSLSALNGSTAGGLMLVIQGYGFSTAAGETQVLFFGNIPASLVRLTNAALTILTPSALALVSATSPKSVSTVVKVVIGGVSMYSSQSFTFVPTLQYTPQVTSLSPSSGWMGSLLTIQGKGFGNYSSANQVVVGGQLCAIYRLSWAKNGTRFQCALGPTPYGKYWVYVTIANKGYAKDATVGGTQLWFSSNLEVTGIYPSVGSVGGGTFVKIVGRGLGNITVQLCGQPALVNASSYNSVVFQTAPLSTLSAFNALGHLRVAAVAGKLFTTTPSSTTTKAVAAFDQNYDTYFQSSYPCYIGYDFGAGWGALISRIRFYPRVQYSSYMQGGVFESSNNALSWTPLATVQNPVEAWNFIDIRSAAPARYLRFRSTQRYCLVAELEFVGVILSSSPQCSVNITFGSTPANFATRSLKFTYQVASTPTVTALSPRSGTAMGYNCNNYRDRFCTGCEEQHGCIEHFPLPSPASQQDPPDM